MGNRKQISETVGYQSVGCVIGGDAYLHAVAYHDLDTVFFHPAGEYSPYGDVVFALNFHGAAT